MGLDTTHDCWHGAYSEFMRWRQKIAAVAGLPPLNLMDGFFQKGNWRDPSFEMAQKTPVLAEVFYEALPIQWESLKPSALHVLLCHSDCDGEIESKDCGPIADELEKLLPILPDEDGGGHIGNWREKTQRFVDGLRDAKSKQESVEFH